MDDSWRMLIGMTENRKSRKPLPRRRSTEDTWTLPQRPSATSLGPEDFSDVFGGPPRTVLLRQFSATSADTSCEEIFRPPRISRERSEGFYNDMFFKTGSSTNSFSKSKSNSSSVLSSEELSPFRGMADDAFSPFSSKPRPNIQNRWSSSATLDEEQQWQQGPAFSTDDSSYLDSIFIESNFIDNFKNSLDSIFQKCSSGVDNEVIQEHYNYDEAISSYASEICKDNPDEVEEAVDIDEAIVWAKGKFFS